MYLKLNTSDGDGYISTMLDEETSLVCKPVSGDEVSQMVKEYRKNNNFIVNEISPKKEWNISSTQTKHQLDLIRQQEEAATKTQTKMDDSKSTLEFNRYKQDCRKRALDLAHSQLTGHNWQQFIEDNDFVKGGRKEEKVIIEDTMLTSLADKYYNWLISIPQ